MLSFFGLITLPIFFMFLSGGLLRTVENAALACQLGKAVCFLFVLRVV